MTRLTKYPKTQSNENINQYHYINTLLFLVVFCLLLFVKLNWFTIQCVYAAKGLTCKTCGLTRTFYAALDGNFSVVPTYFLILFLIIGGQLLLRPLISILLFTTSKPALIRNADITISILMFILFLILIVK